LLHVILALYILCFAGGATLIIFSMLISRRLAAITFKTFALLFLSATMLMLVEALKTYEKALQTDFGLGLDMFSSVFSFVANGMMGWYLPLVALELVRIELTRSRQAVHIVIAVILAVLGGMKEIAFYFLIWNIDFVALLALHAYGAFILLKGFNRIEHPWVRSLVRSFLIFLGAFTPLAVAQLAIQDMPFSPHILHDYPIEELLYYLGFVILFLVYITGYITGPSPAQLFMLSDDFMQRHSISKREGEIITMILHGYSNRQIGETLFISALTVKNHIYHIYQKTGVENKIQLLNLINSPK
jgi:DNA-binding CsgD family transcriptional regulator